MRNHAKSQELTRNHGSVYNNKIQAFGSKQHMATKALNQNSTWPQRH